MCDTSEREAEEKVQQKDQLKREMVRQVMEGDRSKVTNLSSAYMWLCPGLEGGVDSTDHGGQV